MAYNPNTKLLLQFTESDGATRTFDKSAFFRSLEHIGTPGPFVVAGTGPNGENVLRCGDPYGAGQQAMLRALRPTPAKLYDPAVGGSMRFDFFFNQRLINGSYQYLFGWGAQDDRYLRARLDAAGDYVIVEAALWTGETSATITFPISVSSWHHLRIYINGQTMAVGCDGAQKYLTSSAAYWLTPTDQTNYPFTLFDIGGFESQYFCGDIAGFQYLQNDDTWTGGAYTVPTGNYDAAPLPSSDYNVYTSLQLRFDSAGMGDTSSYQHPVTVSGVAARTVGDGPFADNSLHVGNASDPGSVAVNSPGTIWGSATETHSVDMFLWHDSASTNYDYLLTIEDASGALLRLNYYGGVITCDWSGGGDSASLSAGFAAPVENSWHHLRLVIANSMLILACDGVEQSRVNIPRLAFNDYSTLTSMVVGRYSAGSWFRGRITDVVFSEGDYSYYDGTSNNGGPYPVPQAPPTKATLEGPLSVSVSGQSFDYAQGGLLVGLPKSVTLSGQNLTYAAKAPTVRVSHSPSFHRFFGTQFATRFVADDLLAKPGAMDGGAALANEFWDALPEGLANVSIPLTGQVWSFSQGGLTKSVTGGPVEVSVSGQNLNFAQGVLAPGASKSLVGQQISYAQGGIAAGNAKTLSGQSETFTLGALGQARSKGIAGTAVSFTPGSLSAAVIPDYDPNTLMLVKFNEASGAQAVYSSGLVKYRGDCHNLAAVASGQGRFGSNGVAVGNPGGTIDPLAFVEFNDVTEPSIYGMFLNAGPTVPKQFDIWFKPTTNNSHTLFSVEFTGGIGLYLRSNMDSVEVQLYDSLELLSLGYASAAKASNLNTWKHYRVLVSGNSVRVGYDGAELCSFTTAGNAWPGDPAHLPYAIDAAIIRIGRPMSCWDSTTYDFMAAQGYFDDFVITAGAVGWSGGSYSVPTGEPTDAPYIVLLNGAGENTLDAVISTGSGEVRNSIIGTSSITLDDMIGEGQASHDFHVGAGSNTLDDITSEGSAAFGVIVWGAGANLLDDLASAGSMVATPIATGSGAVTLDSFVSNGVGGIGWIVGAGSLTLDNVTSSGAGNVYDATDVTGEGANTVEVIGSGTGRVDISGVGANTVELSSAGTVTNEKFATGENTVEILSSGSAIVITTAQGANRLDDLTSAGAGIGILFALGDSLVEVNSSGVGSVLINGFGSSCVEILTVPQDVIEPALSAACIKRAESLYIRCPAPPSMVFQR